MTSGRFTMSTSAPDDNIGRWAAARRLPQVYLERWLALVLADRRALLEIVESLPMRTGQFIAAFELLGELAVREREPIAAVLARPELRRILDGAGSGPEKASRLLGALRALRYPRMKEFSDRIAAAIAALELPRGIAVVLPRDLASDELRIEIVARGGAELESLALALAQKLNGLKRIAEMIGGADEV
jgi:hypothetical protein